MAGWEDAPVVGAAPKRDTWQQAPITTPVGNARVGSGVLDAIQAGYQGSATGLALRGKLPDVVLDSSHAKWYERLAAGATQMGAEAPEMVIGAAAGGAVGSAAGPVGTILGGGAGAFAVPTAIRESLIQAYSSGAADSSGDFLTRAGIVIKHTAKDALIGAATFGVGGVAARVAGKAIAPAIGETISVGTARTAISAAQTTAEIGTMVVTPAALEGKLPEPQDFLDAAVMVVGVKGAVRAAGKIRQIYAKTGVPPEQVVADAKADPTVALDLKADAAVSLKDGHTITIETSKEGPARGADRQEVFNINHPPKEGDFTLFAKNEKGEVVGHLDLQIEKDSTVAVPRDVQVSDAYKRQGVATALYDQAAKMGLDVKESELQTAAGKALRTALSKRQRNEVSTTTISNVSSETKPGLNGVAEPVRAEAVTSKGMPLVLEREFQGKYRVTDAEGNRVGAINYTPTADGTGWKVTGVDVRPEFQRKGVATAVYDFVEQHVIRGKFESAGGQSEAGAAFRAARRNAQQAPFDNDLDFTVPRAYQEAAATDRGRMIVPGEKAQEVANSPFAEIPQARGEPTKPTHVNYNYINTPSDVKAAMARMSEVYAADIQTQRRGAVSWAETSHEAGKILSDTLGGVDQRLLMPREPGTPAGAAEILARKQLMIGAAEEMMRAREALVQKGTNASAEDTAAFLAAIDRAAMIQAEFLGARSEAGRALNILKETKVAAERAQQIQEVLDRFGKNPAELARMLGEIDNPTGALKFARKVTSATTFEKYIEALKAGLVSGPITQIKNVLGNTTFLFVRPLIDTGAAVTGLASRGERVHVMEPAVRVIGNMQGFVEALHIAGAFTKSYWRTPMEALRTLDAAGARKSESFKHAIEGDLGVIVRTPFAGLQIADALFKLMVERGEINTLAARKTVAEGLNPLTAEFRARFAEHVQNPTAEMDAAATKAGLRFTFNTDLGPMGQAVQNLLNKIPLLKIEMPFVRTPGNVFKEMFRMTPLAPFIDTWRADFAEGGVARHRAIAEVAVGTTLAAVVMSFVTEGELVSGAGDPDPAKRRVQMAAGWQPYSVKLNGTWYSYEGLQPLGTLIGLSADIAYAWKYMTEGESDKVMKTLSIAFANSVTNQTFLQGAVNTIRALSEPSRYGERFGQALVAMHVPGLLSQTAQLMDPYMREINSVLDAVKNRIPMMRETLIADRDPWGEPVKNRERMGGVSPVRVSADSQDKVRTEAARLHLGVEQPPKTVTMPAGRDRKLGEVKLTPEQKDIFGDVSGHLAHEVLDGIVNSPTWDSLPDMVKRRQYEVVFERARKVARAEALTPEQRMHEVDRISDEIARRLGQ